jgi:LEA14-like dessication related protein
MDSGRTAGVAVVVVVLLLGITAYGLLVVDRPQIDSVETSWGTVTENRTEVETEIRVDNPFLLSLSDSAADVRYTVSLNGIVIATERKEQVRLRGRDDVITTSTWVNNDKIPPWWVSHINRNETTTVTVDPTVIAQYGGFDTPADQWTRRRTVQTDLLAPLESDQQRQVAAFDRTVLVVTETDAEWGTATRERTPINGSVTATNALPVPLPVTEIQYTIRMNGIVVGQGTAAQQTVIPPGETRTLDTDAFIDNSKLDEWWVTHLRTNQTSQFSVDFTATVDYAGRQRRLPLDSVSYSRTFHTDLLDSDGAANSTDSVSESPTVHPQSLRVRS